MHYVSKFHSLSWDLGGRPQVNQVRLYICGDYHIQFLSQKVTICFFKKILIYIYAMGLFDDMKASYIYMLNTISIAIHIGGS